jgi:hypothetical protein
MHPAAVVRIGLCREPYRMAVCDRHLAQLQEALPASSVWVIERYAPPAQEDVEL